MPKMFDEVFRSLRYVRALRRDKLRHRSPCGRRSETATQRERLGGETPPEGQETKFSVEAIDYLQRLDQRQEVAESSTSTRTASSRSRAPTGRPSTRRSPRHAGVKAQHARPRDVAPGRFDLRRMGGALPAR